MVFITGDHRLCLFFFLICLQLLYEGRDALAFKHLNIINQLPFTNFMDVRRIRIEPTRSIFLHDSNSFISNRIILSIYHQKAVIMRLSIRKIARKY